MKKRITLAAAITVLTLSQAFADSATLTLDAAYLKTALGVKIPENTGLLMLVASRMDALFGTPTSAAFTTDDDVELGRWALTGGGADGTFSQTIVLDLTGNLTTGDPVELLWFPSLNVASSQPGLNTSYGVYRATITSGTNADGSAPWLVPAASATEPLKFFTSDFGSAVNTATSGVDFGEASLTVIPVPEPGTAGLVIAGIAGLLFMFRRRRSA